MSRTTEPKTAYVPAPSEPQEGFLRRWSQRKAQARAAHGEGEQGREDAGPDAQEAVAMTACAADTAAPKTDADMPPLAELNDQSDYSVFFAAGVSEELRTQALRRLFSSARFNQLCPLESEYFEAAGFTPLGSVVTHEVRAALEREAVALGNKLIEREAGDEPSAPAHGAHPRRAAQAAEPAAPQAQRPAPGRRS